MTRAELQRVARLFLWGFEDTDGREAIASLAEFVPSGMILFRRNIESAAQVRRLTKRIRRRLGADLLIGVDEEGGRVSRLKEIISASPPAVSWGEKLVAGQPKAVFTAAKKLGKSLISLGINLDFAPVLDVHSNPKNPIIEIGRAHV